MSNSELQERIFYILANLDQGRRVIRKAYEIRTYLIDLVLNGNLAENDFYRITSLLTPQSRSPIWEKYFICKYGCRKVKRNENRGDLEKNGRWYEYKASGFNQGNDMNIVQVRLWQNCDYIIQSISDSGAITFVLTHSQMVNETKLCNAASAHGTKQVTDVNQHNELRFTVSRDSEGWTRWVQTYQRTNPFVEEFLSGLQAAGLRGIPE